MTEFASRGDPRRSMALLWGVAETPSRGPKPGLTVQEIVAIAVELADTGGLPAVSMRNVAERLGRSPMSLYTYVPGKAELLDLMLDAALAELPAEYPSGDGWRAAAEASARAGWDLYHRHPWMLQVSGVRSLLSPHELDAYEAQLQVFDGLGLSGTDMNQAVSVLGSFVRGAAKAMSDALTAEQATGLSDDEWWNARSPLLEELAGDAFEWETRYPIITRLATEQAFDQLDRSPDDATSYLAHDVLTAFEFGLQRLLDGLGAYIEKVSS